MSLINNYNQTFPWRVSFLEWTEYYYYQYQEKDLLLQLQEKNWQSLLVSYLLQTEAAVQRCSVRKMFLEISQNS